MKVELYIVCWILGVVFGIAAWISKSRRSTVLRDGVDRTVRSTTPYHPREVREEAGRLLNTQNVLMVIAFIFVLIALYITPF